MVSVFRFLGLTTDLGWDKLTAMGNPDVTTPALAAWNRLCTAARELVPGLEVESRWKSVFCYQHREARESVIRPTDPHRVVFVARGFVRFYTLSEDGSELNQYFGVAGDFVQAFLAEQQGIPYGAEALEPSELLVSDTVEWERLRESPAGALLLEVQSRMLEHKARHSQILQHRETRQRIEVLRAWKPEWWVRAPQYHLANYLGVSEVTLSRALARNRS